MSSPLPANSTHPPPAVAGVRAILRLLFMAVLVLFVWYLASGIKRVSPGEVALVERLGRVDAVPTQPGLLFSWPPPWNRVVLIPGLQILEMELNEWEPRQDRTVRGVIQKAALHPVGDGYSLTGDRNILQGRFVVRFRVSDAAAYYLRSSNPDFGLDRMVYQSITNAFALRTVDEVLTGERELVTAEILRETQNQADAAGLGIEVLAVEIHELVPPLWVISSFQEVINAQVEAETFVEAALNDAAGELPAAEATAFRIRGEADISAENVTSVARAGAESFRRLLAEARTDPRVFTSRLRSESLQRIFKGLRATALVPSMQEGGLRLLVPALPPATFDEGLPLMPSAPLNLEDLED
jgi:membrane protease subunit HflK